MRLPRWGRHRDVGPDLDEGLRTVADELRQAANAAPVSGRVDEARLAMLREVDEPADTGPGVGLVWLTAAALLLALTIGVGGPLVGSLLDGTPEATDASGAPEPSDQPIAEPTPPLEPSPSEVPSVAATESPDADPSPSASEVAGIPVPAGVGETPEPVGTPPPQVSPGGPPSPMPTPPNTGPPGSTP